MKQKKLISLALFNERYSLPKNTIHVGKSKGTINASAFEKIKNSIMIDEKFFIRRVGFKKRVWLEAHDFYYWLSKHLKDTQMSELLAKIDGDESQDCINNWNMFIHKTLFYRPESSVLVYKISPTLWKFWRYGRWIFNALHRLRGIQKNKRDIERYLACGN